MNILCLSRAPLDYKAGIPTYCLNLYRGSKDKIFVYSYDIEKKIKKVKKVNRDNIIEIIFPSELIIGTLALSIQYFQNLISNGNRFSIIHLQHPDPLSAMGAILVKIINRRTKIVITWHAEIYSNYKIFAPILLIIDLILFKLADKIIYFTPYHIKDSLLAKFKFIKNKIKQINYGIERPNISEKDIINKRSNNISEKGIIKVLSIGRLVTYKGYEYSIQAIKNTKSNVIYYIIGTGPLKIKLKKLINELGLEKRVFLLGNLNDEEKNKYTYNSDILLFPSINKSEAFGIVQLEAMSYGIPIINTMLNNGVNYLAPNNIAVTCQIKKIDQLSDSINNLIKDKEKYNKLSLNSLNRSYLFVADKMRKEHYKIYNEIIED